MVFQRPSDGQARVKWWHTPGRTVVHWGQLAYVYFETPERTQKLSAEWFRETARKNGCDAPRRTSRATGREGELLAWYVGGDHGALGDGGR